MPYELIDEGPYELLPEGDDKATKKRAHWLAPELDYRNIGLGALKGAADIGSTLLGPVASIANRFGASMLTGNERRKANMDALQSMGADPSSMAFKAGELGADIAGTAGLGGVAGRLALKAGAPVLANAFRSGGLSLGVPGATTLAGKAGNAALRVGAGGAVGGLTAGAINPEDAAMGAMLGGALPGVVGGAGWAGKKLAGMTEGVAESLMNSALKPTLKAHQTGDAKVAVRTMLKEGVNPTQRGVEKLRGLVEQTDDDIARAISGSPATIDQARVLERLNDTRNRFGMQVDPSADLAAIDRVGESFATHPKITGKGMVPAGDAKIPVDLAQELKRGTYGILAKKYGQLGSAETEAQKALARGLKEEIATAVPEISALNAREADLLKTLKVADRRVQMGANRNPVGLGWLGDLKTLPFWLMDRSDVAKSLMARGLTSAGAGAQAYGGLLGRRLEDPAVRAGLLAIEANQ